MQRSIEERGPLTIVFTQKGETADHYIERQCDEHARAVEIGRLEIRVATSDNTEQTVVFGRGAIRISSRELIYEMRQARQDGGKYIRPAVKSGRSTVLEHLPEAVRSQIEKLRRGET